MGTSQGSEECSKHNEVIPVSQKVYVKSQVTASSPSEFPQAMWGSWPCSAWSHLWLRNGIQRWEQLSPRQKPQVGYCRAHLWLKMPEKQQHCFSVISCKVSSLWGPLDISFSLCSVWWQAFFISKQKSDARETCCEQQEWEIRVILQAVFLLSNTYKTSLAIFS